jgi:hypothetical protein
MFVKEKINMATYEGICKLTNTKEKIWFDMIPVDNLSQSDAIVGLMNDCSVRKILSIDLCEECNLYNDLSH